MMLLNDGDGDGDDDDKLYISTVTNLKLEVVY